MMDPQSLLILNFGTVILWLCGITSTCCIIYWLFWDKRGAIHHLKEWPEDEKNYITTIHLYIISSYCLTLISSMYFFNSPSLLHTLEHNKVRVVAFTVISTLILSHHQEIMNYSPRTKEKKNWLWFTQSVIVGPSLTFFGSTIFVVSIFDTLLAIFLSTLVAYSGPDIFFQKLIPYVNFMYSGVLMSSILNFLFVPPITTFSVFLLILDFLSGIALYFCVFALNMDYILKEARARKGDPVHNASVMYLCTVNLYLRIAMRYIVEEILQ